MSRAFTCCGVLFVALSVFFLSCTTGVEPSPHPGIIRVTLKASETDTALVIQNDTTRFSRWDSFNLIVFGGRVYRGDNYSQIYVNRSIQRIGSDTVNILAREWLNGVPITTADTSVITPTNSRYRKYAVFESLVPQGNYELLEFGLLAYEVETFIPKVYSNTVQLPPGTSPQVPFPTPFSIQEDRVTQIDIEIFPFKSLHRFQDSFLFDRKMQIVNIQVL